MKLFRTLRTQQPSFSTDNKVLNIAAPKSWKELTQDQLRYVLTLLVTFDNSIVVRTYMLVRFAGIHIIRRDRYGWQCFVRTTWWGKRKFFTLQAWQIEDLIEQLKYIDSYEDMSIRLEDIHGLRAVDLMLHNLSFLDYLNAEKYYQLYMQNNSDEYLKKLALILYRKKNGSFADSIKLSLAEMLGVYMWYSFVKLQFSKTFRHFFKKIEPSDVEDFDLRAAIDIQIRALTDGDVTKEKEILSTSCWRALTELDAKARESEEFKAKYNK